MLLLSRVITQFYIESFISKELEVRLHQNINYPVHSHLGDGIQPLPSSSWPGHSPSVRSCRQTVGPRPASTLQGRMSGACPLTSALSSPELQGTSLICTSLSVLTPFPSLPPVISAPHPVLPTKSHDEPQNHKLGVKIMTALTNLILYTRSWQTMALRPNPDCCFCK